MTAWDLSSGNGKRARGTAGRQNSPTSKSRARRRVIATFVATGMLSLSALMGPSYGQVVGPAGPPVTNRGQPPALVTADSLSCKQLKDSLQSAGTLNIVSGQRSWGDTFYGPGVPQCEFWSRPMFQYVTANDGPCGVGYICAQRVTGGR